MNDDIIRLCIVYLRNLKMVLVLVLDNFEKE